MTLDIAKIIAMAEAEIMASILWHYHALLHQTKDISPPTVTAAHFQEKIQISEQHIAKYHKNCPTKGKRRFILLPMLNLLLNKIKKQISRKARRPSPRNLCSSQHFRDAPKKSILAVSSRTTSLVRTAKESKGSGPSFGSDYQYSSVHPYSSHHYPPCHRITNPEPSPKPSTSSTYPKDHHTNNQCVIKSLHQPVLFATAHSSDYSGSNRGLEEDSTKLTLVVRRHRHKRNHESNIVNLSSSVLTLVTFPSFIWVCHLSPPISSLFPN